MTITKDNFDSEVFKDGIILVKFSATWCQPCKVLDPLLDKVKAAMDAENLPMQIGKVDIEVSGDIAALYNIRNVPTCLIFKNGEIVDRTTGVTPNFYEHTIEKLKRLS